MGALSTEARAELTSLLNSAVYDGSVGWRAQIVLWDDQGYSVSQIASKAGTSRVTVYKWLRRFRVGGIDALSSLPPGGRPRVISAEQRARILAISRTSPPPFTGLTHWSTAQMAKYLATYQDIHVSHNFVAMLWRENGLRPHQQGTFKLSKDPQFAVKVADIVGLYLDPPDGAVVLSMDEKTQIQALDRTAPLLPMTFFKTEKRTADYVRHGTTNLLAAFNTATGEVTGQSRPRKRTKEFLAFMSTVIAGYPDQQIHVIMDNLATHKTAAVGQWLDRHPNVHFHYTPTGSSWLNQIECWFSIITKQSLSRATSRSVRELNDHIAAYITTWNTSAHPFTWTATADDIISRVQFVQTEFNALLDSNSNSRPNSVRNGVYPETRTDR